MIWDQLRGHQAQIEMFRRAISRGRLAHAYLLVGPHGIGKRTFARLLAQCLFCQQHSEEELLACGVCSGCKQVQANTHPDLLQVGCPKGKKEIPIEVLVGSTDRRGREGLCHDLAMRPMSATRRVAIIDDAELMNEAGANSLLKTLEEPPRGSMIFLITPETEPILPTIRSRCQPVRFSPLAQNDLAELLVQTGLLESGPAVEEVARLADGSLTTAQELLEPELRTLQDVVQKHLAARDMRPLAAVGDITAALDAFGSDSATHRRYASWAIRFCVETLRISLSTAETPTQSDQLGAMLDRCVDAEMQLHQSMPVPLCLEGLFDTLARIQRQSIFV